MVGYENARDDPLLDGREYATTFSIMEALGNPNPEDFVKIFHDRFWDDKSIDGRRLATFWQKMGKAFKCAGMVPGPPDANGNQTFINQEFKGPPDYSFWWKAWSTLYSSELKSYRFSGVLIES